MTNKELRNRAKFNAVPLWQIADKVGVAEITIIRWFRHEMDEEKKETIDRAISEIIAERD